MPSVTDIQSWADNLEYVRLPQMEADAQSTSALLNQKIQEFSDEFSAKSVQIAVAATARTQLSTEIQNTTTQLYDYHLGSRTYTDAAIQSLRTEFNQSIGNIQNIIEDNLLDLLNGALPDYDAGFASTLIDVQAVRDEAQETMDDMNAAISSLMVDTIPPLNLLITSTNDAIQVVQTNYDALVSGFEDGSLLAGFDNVRGRLTALDYDMSSRIEDIARIDRDMDLRIARELDVSGSIDNINSMLLSTMLALSETESRMADAGIIVDPTNGRVTIEAISRMDDEFGYIIQTIDAQQAEINTRITYTDAATMIAEAQLSPEDMPIIEDLLYRITNVEVTYSALEGAIENKVDTLIVDGINVELVSAVTRIDTLEEEIVNRITSTEFSELTTRVTSAETVLSTYDGAAFSIALSDISATTQSAYDAEITSLGQLLNLYESRETLRVDLAYLNQNMRALVDEDRESIATLSTEMGVAFADTLVLIETERTARATENAGIAEDLIAMEVRVVDAEAGLLEINRIEADSESASARALHQLQMDLSVTTEDVAGVVSAITALDTRIEDTEEGLLVASNDRRQLTAGILSAEDDAAIESLRNTLLTHDTNNRFMLGVADAREDFYARVLEGEEAIAGDIQELTVGLNDALALVTAERVARVTQLEAETLDRLAMRVEMDAATAASLQTVRDWVDADSAIAERTLALEATVDGDENTPGVSSRVGSLETAISDETTGLAARVGQLEVSVDDGETGLLGRMDTLEGVVITDEGALVTKVAELEAVVEDPETGLAATATALDGALTRITDTEEGLVATSATVSLLRASSGDTANIVPDPNYVITGSWVLQDGWSIQAPSSLPGFSLPNSIRFTPFGESGWSGYADSGVFPVTQGTNYLGSYEVNRASAGTFQLRCTVIWMDDYQAWVSTEIVDEATQATDGVREVSFGLTCPDGATQAKLRFTVNNDAGAASCEVSSARFERETSIAARTQAAVDDVAFAISDPATGIAAKVSSLEASINGDENQPGISAELSDLQAIVVDPEQGIVTQVSGLLVEIEGDAENAGILSRLDNAETALGTVDPPTGLAGSISTIETTVNDPDSGVVATATSLASLLTYIGENGETVLSDVRTLSTSDSSNIIPGANLTNDRFWALYDGWSLLAPVYIPGIAFETPGVLNYTPPENATGWSQTAQSMPFAVLAGNIYETRFQAVKLSVGTVSAKVSIRWFDANETQVSETILEYFTLTDPLLHVYPNTIVAPYSAVTGILEITVDNDSSDTGIVIAAPVIERETIGEANSRGRIDDIYSLSMDDTSVIGAWIQSINVTYGDVTAFVNQTSGAVATAEGLASATHALRVGAGGATAGLELMSVDDPDGPASTIRMDADNILFRGTILAEHMQVASFATAGLALFGGSLQAINYERGVSGWRITREGEIEAASLLVNDSMVVRGTLTTGAISDGAISAEAHEFTTPFAGTSDADFIVIAGSAYQDVVLLDEMECSAGHDVVLSLSCNIDAPAGSSWGVFAFERRIWSGSDWGAWSNIRYSDTGLIAQTVIGGGPMTPFHHSTVDKRNSEERRQYRVRLKCLDPSTQKLRLCRVYLGAQQFRR